MKHTGHSWKVTNLPLEKVTHYKPITFFPFVENWRAYHKSQLRGDWVAALNVSLLAFPQGIAYALIAGLPVSYGIFGSAVAAIIGAFFSRNHYIVFGPTNATAVLLMSGFAGLGLAYGHLAVLPLIVFLSGTFLLIGAYLRLSAFIQYVSRTVVVGYITAAALLIIANQLKSALGFSFGDGVHATTFFETLYYTYQYLGHTHWPSVLISLVTAIVYLLLYRFVPALPNVAITLAILSVVGYLFVYLDVKGLAMLDPFSITQWKFTLPPFELNLIRQIVGLSLALALLSILEGSSIGKSQAARYGDRLHTNQEMYSMGMANVGCGLFSGMPASGSLTRSVLNCQSGATSTLSCLYGGILIVVGAWILGPLIRFIPLAALAVLIICIGFSLLQMKNIRLVLKATKADRAVFLVSVAVGLLFGLDLAIYAGAGLSIILFLRQAAHPELVEYQFRDDGQLAQLPQETPRKNPEVSIVHVEGDLFFGASEIFRDQMRRICNDENLKVLILRMKNAHFLDATSIMALEDLCQHLEEQGRHLIICGIRKDIYQVIHDSGMEAMIGRENLFMESMENPTLSTSQAVKRAKELLGDQQAHVTLYGNF